jgi:hypothetical protein
MGGITWRNGRDLDHLAVRVKRRGEELRECALEITEQAVAMGAVATQDLLEDAVTPTGLRREAERGGFPGRHDSGEMVGSVSYEVRHPRARRVWGVFGWWGSNFEDYFRDQDLGEGNIPPARALPQAYLRAEQFFRARMRRLVQGR